MNRVVVSLLGVVAAVGAMLLASPPAQADYDMGCERVGWGFFMSGYRDICDGPKRPDGSWDRTRREWTPAHWYTPYCNYRSWYCNPAYYVEESTQRLETYPVSDAPGAINQPLPNEPGWLPPGSLVVR